MQHDETPARDLTRDDLVPAQTGPVELDPALLAFVSGGAPRSGWATTTTTSVTDPSAPRSGWL